MTGARKHGSRGKVIICMTTASRLSKSNVGAAFGRPHRKVWSIGNAEADAVIIQRVP